MSNNYRPRFVAPVEPLLVERIATRIEDSFRRMYRSLNKAPHPTLFRQMGHGNKMATHMATMIVSTKVAGADPVDLTIPGYEITQIGYELRDDIEFTRERLRLVSCREQSSDHKVDMHQTALTGNESPEELARFAQDVGEHIERLRDLLRTIAAAQRLKQAEYRQTASLRRTARQRISASA